MAMVSIKSFAKEIRKTLTYKIAPAQTKLIVSVYKFSNTVTWGRVQSSYRNCSGLKMKFNMY